MPENESVNEYVYNKYASPIKPFFNTRFDAGNPSYSVNKASKIYLLLNKEEVTYVKQPAIGFDGILFLACGCFEESRP